MRLPAYKGSTFRGGFGHAFKRTVCAARDKTCRTCLLKEKCVYAYVFETPPPKSARMMRKYEAAPHPFVIRPPNDERRNFNPGDKINFELALIGKATDYLPYFIYAFQELGSLGIGKGKAKYSLTTVQDAQGNTIYNAETNALSEFSLQTLSFLNGDKPTADKARLTLSFITPTRIIFQKHLTMDLEFHILIRVLLRRLSLLVCFHMGIDPSGWDFKGLIERAGKVSVVKRNLKWIDWERYSNRQETKMKMGGFVGDVEFEGELGEFLPLIRAGEALHVGKGTGMGLGRYEIRD